MSIKVMNWIWQNSDVVDVKGSQLVLLLAIADNANDDGEAFPSITHLAKKCRLSRQSIIDHTAKLELTGHLAVIAGKRGRSNRYHLTSYRTAHGLLNDAIEKKAREPKLPEGGQDGFTSQADQTGVVNTGLPSSQADQTVIVNNRHLTTNARAYSDLIVAEYKRRGMPLDSPLVRSQIDETVRDLSITLDRKGLPNPYYMSIDDLRAMIEWMATGAGDWVDFSASAFTSKAIRAKFATRKIEIPEAERRYKKLG